MNIQELQLVYESHPNTKAFVTLIENKSTRTIFLEGLCASAAPLFVSSYVRQKRHTLVCILNDLEEAGYFYHDLTQVCGDDDVLFFPSAYRRAIKYGQKDSANEILRTEALSRLGDGTSPVCIVTYPEALAEKVVSCRQLSERTLTLEQGGRADPVEVAGRLSGLGFERVDYVYEPGQYAVRGSILDVFSFSSEYPYRVDFFGDEIDSIRTFEVDSQLSKERRWRGAAPRLPAG